MRTKNRQNYTYKLAEKIQQELKSLLQLDSTIDEFIIDINIKQDSQNYPFKAQPKLMVDVLNIYELSDVISRYLSEFKEAYRKDKKLHVMRLIIKRRLNTMNIAKPIEIDMTTKN